jgi:hypothetical protein
MSADLERRLRDVFDSPRPSRDVTARARAAALAVVPVRRRRAPRLLVAFAVVVVAVGLGAAALAATGKLRVAVGAGSHRAAPAPVRLTVPAGTHGIALVAGGRLWLVTRRGLRIEGMAVSAAELSPRALYAAVGVGSSLAALAPGGRRAWTHAAGGRVVAAAWSPDGLEIAYVVRRGGGAQLRLIEGDGDHDHLLARDVAPVRPVWRRDALALAYLRADGRRALLDFRRGRTTVGRVMAAAPTVSVPSPARDGRVASVVVAPGRAALQIAGRGGVRTVLRVRAARSPVSISWR